MTAMTTAWLIGPPLAIGYAFLTLRGTTMLAQAWERRHPHTDNR